MRGGAGYFPRSTSWSSALHTSVDAPAADLDNIVKPLQDALKGVAFGDDIQVVDLVASMRRKGESDRVPMPALLASVFKGGSDFVYVAVDRASTIEVFR